MRGLPAFQPPPQPTIEYPRSARRDHSRPNGPAETPPCAGLSDRQSTTLACPATVHIIPTLSSPCKRRVRPSLNADRRQQTYHVCQRSNRAHTTSRTWPRKERAAVSAPRLPPALLLRLPINWAGSWDREREGCAHRPGIKHTRCMYWDGRNRVTLAR